MIWKTEMKVKLKQKLYNVSDKFWFNDFGSSKLRSSQYSVYFWQYYRDM